MLAFAPWAPARRSSALEAAVPRDSGALLALQTISEKLTELERRIERIERAPSMQRASSSEVVAGTDTPLTASPPPTLPSEIVEKLRELGVPPPANAALPSRERVDLKYLDACLVLLAQEGLDERWTIVRVLCAPPVWNEETIYPALLERLRKEGRRPLAGVNSASRRSAEARVRLVDAICQGLRGHPRKAALPELIEMLLDPPEADDDYLSVAITGLIEAWLQETPLGRMNLPPHRRVWQDWWARMKDRVSLPGGR
ncbi:MAG: hypothetical protein L0216_20190 [Planctomycetales bacterium]|nr:hypothetical protein [Planctomycetales bacterium]